MAEIKWDDGTTDTVATPKAIKWDDGTVEAVSTANVDNTPEWAGKYPNLYGALGATKEVARMGGELAAMGLGAAGGTLVGGPIGGVAGAGGGLALVKQAENYLEGKPLDKQEMKKDFMVGAAGQALPIVAKGIDYGGITRRIGNKVMGVTDDISQKIKDVQDKFGITMTKAQATGSRNLGLFESMLEKTPFSATIMDRNIVLKQLQPLIKLREKALEENNYQNAEQLGMAIQKQVNTFTDGLKIADEAKRLAAKQRVIEKLGSNESFENLGKSAIEALEKRSAEAVAKKNAVFSEIGEFIPKEKVATPALAETAQKHMKAIRELPNQDAELANVLQWSMKKDKEAEFATLMEQIKAYPPAVQKQILAESGITEPTFTKRDWGTLQNFRSQLNDLIKANNTAMKAGNAELKGQANNKARIYSDLKASLDKDMESIAEQTGGEAWDKFRAANAFFKEEYAPIWKDAKVIGKIATSNPMAVVDVVMQPKNIMEVDTLRKAIGSQSFDANIKPAITNKMLGKSSTFDPNELASNIEKYGDEVLSKIYAPAELSFLKRIAAGEGIDMNGPIPSQMKPLISDIAKRTPSTVVDAIVGMGTDKITNPSRVIENLANLRVMVDKDTLQSINGELANRIFRVNPKTDYVSPEALTGAIARMKPALRIFMKPDQVKWLDDLSKITREMSYATSRANNPSGTAQNIIVWGSYGFLLNEASGAWSDLKSGNIGGVVGHVAKAGMMVLTPRAMANIYLSDPGRKLFSEAMRTPVSSKRAAEIATKLATIAAGDTIED